MGHSASSCEQGLVIQDPTYHSFEDSSETCTYQTMINDSAYHNNQFIIDSDKKEYLSTDFYGLWSKKAIQKHPDPRTMMSQCFSSKNEFLYVCFGETLANTPLSDVWQYNMKTNQWKLLSTGKISPRSRSTAIYYNDSIYCFGGLQGKNYTDELLKINPQNGSIEVLQTKGEKPCPRANAILGNFQNKLYVWGGNDGYVVESSIHILDLDTMTWRSVPCSIPSRFAASCVTVEKYMFIFGSDQKNGMLRMNMESESIALLKVVGPHPKYNTNNPSMVRAGGFLFVFGGTSDQLYTQVYGFNMLKNRWFIFHIRADGTSTNIDDGEIRENGCFAVPRESGMAAGLQVSTRSIVYTLGSSMKHDAPVYSFQIGEALSVMNQSEDMLEMLK